MPHVKPTKVKNRFFFFWCQARSVTQMDSSFLVIEMSVDEINYFTTNIPTRPIKIGCLWKKNPFRFLVGHKSCNWLSSERDVDAMKVSQRSGSIFPNEVGVCTLKIRALSTESLCNVFSIKKVLGLTILSQGPFHSALNNCERKKTLSNIIINVTSAAEFLPTLLTWHQIRGSLREYKTY